MSDPQCTLGGGSVRSADLFQPLFEVTIDPRKDAMLYRSAGPLPLCVLSFGGASTLPSPKKHNPRISRLNACLRALGAPCSFLREVGAFDSVDDESRPEREATARTLPTDPSQWDTDENPPYAYYMSVSSL